jgi:hypothetical protein
VFADEPSLLPGLRIKRALPPLELLRDALSTSSDRPAQATNQNESRREK